MSKELFISSSPHETKVAVMEDDQLVEVYFERDTHTGVVGGIYKGRVSRVLPGMQSAFVDIGLERDAFLYVSDFFEDADEYDKIVAEAEARVIRLAEVSPVGSLAPAEPPEEIRFGAKAKDLGADEEGSPALAPEISSASPRAMAESIAPEPPLVEPAPNVLPAYAGTSPSNPSPVPTTLRATDKPGPPSASRRDETRGRRRKRHGRGFGERKFGSKPEFRDRPAERPPVATAPPPEAPAASGFEVLPGESLAKYRHGMAPSSAAAPPAAERHTAGLDSAGREDVTRLDNSSVVSETRHTERSFASTSSREENSDFRSSSPAVDAVRETATEPESASATLTERTSAFENQRSGDRGHDSEPARGTENVAGHAPAQVPPVISAFPSRHASPVESARELGSPSNAESSTASSFPTRTEPPPEPKPRPLWDRLVSTVLGKPAEPNNTQETKPSEASQNFNSAPTTESPNFETPESYPAAASEPSQSDEAYPFASESPDQGSVANSDAEPLEQIPTAGAPAEPAARQYTMREPSQKPRFAPRRGGRQGRGNREFTPASGPAPRHEAPRSGNNQPLQIAELLKEGQEIVVQIAKEPLGRKGARITSHIALPGRYLVYMPTVDHMGVSRKIASEEERLRLKNIMLDNKGSVTGGFIVRTAGAGRPEEELKADMRFLSTLWSDIRAKSERTKAPTLLHRDLDLMQRILRDILSPDFKTVRVDSEVEYERALEFVSRCQPSLVGHVKLFTRDAPLFEEFGIQAEIDKALKSKVWLKSGGYIVINQTEALVAIDVNTGKYVGKTNRLEDTIVKTNIDAVKEIVRQIRLRDLGGIIVIDFIDMDERRNRNKVVQALEEALRFDRAPTKILSFNDFGLVALTRKRVKQSLERTLCDPCAYCSGSGWIKSVTTICYEILAEARKMATEHEGDSLTLRVHPEVARALKSREGVVLAELEAMTHKDVIVKSDASVHQERFEIY